MNYTRGGRPLVKGSILVVEDLNLEGMLGKTFSKTGTVPKSYFQIRQGKKVEITKEEYEALKEKK
jgi:hypothetical protein